MSAKIRVVLIECDTLDAGVLNQIRDMLAGSKATAVIAPKATLTPPPRPRQRTRLRKLVCRDFPDRVWTPDEVKSTFGLNPNTSLTTYVKQKLKVARKHVFEYADEAGIDAPATAESEDDGGDEGAGEDEDDDDPATWAEPRQWRELKATTGRRHDRIRNAIATRYQRLVDIAARSMMKRLPVCVDVEDLSQAGEFGIFDAIERFDPERGLKFTTYAPRRIYGAMGDHLRAYDPVPRLVRVREKKLSDARRKLGRDPKAGDLGLSQKQVDDLLADGNVVQTGYLSHTLWQDDTCRNVGIGDVLVDEQAPDPSQAVTQSDWWDHITRGLDRSETLLVRLYYREEMTMKEIGGVLGLSESRVSQVHSSILGRLKARETAKGGAR